MKKFISLSFCVLISSTSFGLKYWAKNGKIGDTTPAEFEDSAKCKSRIFRASADGLSSAMTTLQMRQNMQGNTKAKMEDVKKALEDGGCTYGPDSEDFSK